MPSGKIFYAVACGVTLAASVWATAQSPAPNLAYNKMAERIVLALKPEKGETAILRFDANVMPELQKETAAALEKLGVKVESIPYGPVDNFEQRLSQTDIYVWLPAVPGRPTEPDQAAALGRWLDAQRGRQIHFHWADGTRAVDSSNGRHDAAFDRIYFDALNIDYAALTREQDAVIARLRAGEVRVTTPQGTDLRFRIGDRPVTRQNGDASREAMKNARVRIDREIELPAGAIRVAPIEESVNGRMVIPGALIKGTRISNIRLQFTNGQITEITAGANEPALRSYLAEGSALRQFREFALGFNPKLHAPMGSPWVAYYGYGAGMVRLSLGDNSELGGNVRGGAVHWFFFPGADISVNGKSIY